MAKCANQKLRRRRRRGVLLLIHELQPVDGIIYKKKKRFWGTADGMQMSTTSLTRSINCITCSDPPRSSDDTCRFINPLIIFDAWHTIRTGRVNYCSVFSAHPTDHSQSKFSSSVWIQALSFVPFPLESFLSPAKFLTCFRDIMHFAVSTELSKSAESSLCKPLNLCISVTVASRVNAHCEVSCVGGSYYLMCPLNRQKILRRWVQSRFLFVDGSCSPAQSQSFKKNKQKKNEASTRLNGVSDLCFTPSLLLKRGRPGKSAVVLTGPLLRRSHRSWLRPQTMCDRSLGESSCFHRPRPSYQLRAGVFGESVLISLGDYIDPGPLITHLLGWSTVKMEAVTKFCIRPFCSISPICPPPPPAFCCVEIRLQLLLQLFKEDPFAL